MLHQHAANRRYSNSDIGLTHRSIQLVKDGFVDELVGDVEYMMQEYNHKIAAVETAEVALGAPAEEVVQLEFVVCAVVAAEEGVGTSRTPSELAGLALLQRNGLIVVVVVVVDVVSSYFVELEVAEGKFDVVFDSAFGAELVGRAPVWELGETLIRFVVVVAVTVAGGRPVV